MTGKITKMHCQGNKIPPLDLHDSIILYWLHGRNFWKRLCRGHESFERVLCALDTCKLNSAIINCSAVLEDIPHFYNQDEQYGLLPHIFETDNFDSCMLLGDEALYCTIEFQLKPLDARNTSNSWKQIQELIDNPKNYRHDRLRHGICIPTTCPNIDKNLTDDSTFKDNLALCYNKKFESKGLYGTLNRMFCQTNQPLPYDSYDIAVITFLVLYVSFIILASFYEGLARYKSKIEYNKITGTPFGKLMSCFSIPNNFYRLKKPSENKSLEFIQGIRFYNMILVITTHCIMGTLIGPVSNLQVVERFTDEFSNILFTGGAHAVQTFFLISAWLLTYHVLRSFEDKKNLSMKTLGWILVNRYIRLTPPFAILLAIQSSLLVHTPKGPYWDHIVGEEYRNCRKNAWTNLLYINNHVNPSEMCMQQTWYMAADTQLFVLALLILAAMKKYKKHIAWILTISLVVGVSIPGILAFLNNYDILLRVYPEPMYDYLLKVEAWHVLYSAGYSNIGAYVIGIILGYLYYIYRNVNLVTSKIHVIMYFVLSYGLSLGIIAVAFPMYDLSYSYSKMESAIYWSAAKNIFSLAIAIGMFGMTQKLGWFSLWLCRWKPVQVLGRLAYSAYLIHVFLLRLKLSAIRSPIFVSKYSLLINSIGDIAVAYLFAFILCMTFEMPVTAIQKLWLPQKKKEDNDHPPVLIVPEIVLEKHCDK